MADVLFLAILVAFFSLAVVFVRACDRMIGPDLEGEALAEPAGTSDAGRPAA